MGRADLIGPGKHQLVPAWQPAGTKGRAAKGGPRRAKFLTKGVLPKPPSAKA